MSADREFVAFVSELFEPLGPLTSGRFFGGHAFKRDGVQFAMVMGNTLYLRVDDETRPAYRNAGAEAFSYTTKKGRVMVESFVEGRELTVGILGQEALPVVEILPEGGLYTYEAKYTKGQSRYEVPADVPAETGAALQRDALLPLVPNRKLEGAVQHQNAGHEGNCNRLARLKVRVTGIAIGNKAGGAECCVANGIPGAGRKPGGNCKCVECEFGHKTPSGPKYQLRSNDGGILPQREIEASANFKGV